MPPSLDARGKYIEPTDRKIITLNSVSKHKWQMIENVIPKVKFKNVNDKKKVPQIEEEGAGWVF